MSDKKKLMEIALEIEAIKINYKNPFKWVSGYLMPIYNDNRLFLQKYEYRILITKLLSQLIENDNFDIIAGIATAGIPHATSLANEMKKPLIYIRNSSKGHGLKKQIEGSSLDELKNKKIVMVEDLISTGKSIKEAYNSLSEYTPFVEVISIFSYNFEKTKIFLEESKIKHKSIFTYDEVLDLGLQKGYFKEREREILQDWNREPFTWAKKYL